MCSSECLPFVPQSYSDERKRNWSNIFAEEIHVGSSLNQLSHLKRTAKPNKRDSKPISFSPLSKEQKNTNAKRLLTKLKLGKIPPRRMGREEERICGGRRARRRMLRTRRRIGVWLVRGDLGVVELGMDTRGVGNMLRMSRG